MISTRMYATVFVVLATCCLALCGWIKTKPDVEREVTESDSGALSHYLDSDGKAKVYSAYYWQKDGNIQQVGDTWSTK